MRKSNIKVTVEDPKKEIASIYLAYESDDCVVVHVNLSKKRQRVTGYSWGEDDDPWTVDLDQATIAIHNLPFIAARMAADTSKYTLLITFVSVRAFRLGFENAQLYPPLTKPKRKAPK